MISFFMCQKSMIDWHLWAMVDYCILFLMKNIEIVI